MITLVLDCAYGSKAAVISQNKQLSFACGQGQREADSYMQTIDKALKEAKLDIDDIDEICINVGPGSFTGLRVALSVAKGLGFGSKINYSTFTSFDYMDSNLPKIIEGFSSFVYVKNGKDIECVDINKLNKCTYCVVTKSMQERLGKEGIDCSLSSQRSYIELVKLAKQEQLKNIAPLYIRASQAELQRAQKTQIRP